MLKLKNQDVVYKSPFFEVQKLDMTENGQDFHHPFYRIHCADWINVLPITENNEAVLIRQYRAGSNSMVLETPGGMVEASEHKDPTLTAVRELEEETGYTTQKILLMASLNPNPALMNNTIHYFLAMGCKIQKDRKHFPDAAERIEVVTVPVSQLQEMVHLGKITHSLSALSICLARKYLKEI